MNGIEFPAFSIRELESDLTWIAIHVGCLFFIFLSGYMFYLQPVTRLEKAVHLKAICLALVLLRTIQYRYWPGFDEASWFGALAWGSLTVSFVYTMYAITTTAFGVKGRQKMPHPFRKK